jgi:hypothetical protein
MRAGVAVLGAVAALSASAAHAQEAPSSGVPGGEEPAFQPRIAVLMLPIGEVDAATADALGELLIAAVAARGDGIRIVGKEEFQAQLGHGDSGTVECIESAACLGRTGVELGVVEVIAGTISRRTEADGTLAWAFNLNRLDVRTGEVLGRVFREVRGDLGALLDALEESFPELYARRVQPGRLVVRATAHGAVVELDGALVGTFDGEPVRRETVEPGHHVVRVRAPGHREYVREIEIEEAATVMLEAALAPAGAWTASPLVWVGSSVASLAAIFAIGLAIASQASPDPSLSMRETIDSFYPAREAEAIAADVLFGVAGAAAIVGVVGLFLSGVPEEPPPARAWIAPTPYGVALGAGGRF